jgi:biopolymer transport protein ExbD
MAEYSKWNQAIKIYIAGKRDIQINNVKTSLANFKTEMDKIKENSGDQILIQLKVDHEVSMHVVFKVQKILREINLRKVMYSDDEERGLDLMLPAPGAEKKLDQIPDKDIMKLKISAEGKVTANDMAVEIADLDRFIKESLKKNDKQVVTIDAEENTSYESFVIVLDKVKKGGAKRVGIYDMSK